MISNRTIKYWVGSLKQTQYLKQNSNFIFRTLQPKDFQEVSYLVADSFTTRDSLIQSLKIDQNEFINYLQVFQDHFLSIDSSIVVEDKIKNVIVACQFNDDFNAPITDQIMRKLSPKFQAITIYFEQMKEKMYKENIFQQSKYTFGRENEILHTFLGSTRPDQANKGLFQEMLTCSAELAQIKGYQALSGEATSPGSQHAVVKWGFRKIYHQPYYSLKLGDHIIDMEIASSGFRSGIVPGILFVIKEIEV